MVEAVGKGGVVEDFAGVVGNGADAGFGRGAVEQVAALQEEAAAFVQPGEVGAGGSGTVGCGHGVSLCVGAMARRAFPPACWCCCVGLEKVVGGDLFGLLAVIGAAFVEEVAFFAGEDFDVEPLGFAQFARVHEVGRVDAEDAE